jgi:hypothetical protein
MTLSQLVFEVGPNATRLVRGLTCTVDALVVYPGDCPLLRTSQIAEAEFNPQNLWTMTSITIARILLLSLWLLTFATLSGMVGLFISWQDREP